MISEAIKPLQLVGQAAQFKFESKFEPLPVIWQSLWRLFQKVIEFRAKSTAKLLGQPSGSACQGRTGEHKHRAFPSQWQSLLAATGSLEENMLPLLRYWLSSRVNKVSMLCKFRAATSHFLFSGEMKIQWNLREVVACQGSAHCFAQSFNHSFVSEQKFMT